MLSLILGKVGIYLRIPVKPEMTAASVILAYAGIHSPVILTASSVILAYAGIHGFPRARE